MIVVTRQSLANEAAERWKRQYAVIKVQYSNDKLAKLEALGPTPNPDDVDEVIGNTAWTHVPKCDECGEHGPVVVQMGEEPDYESRTAYLCPACLEKALGLVSEAGVK